MTKSRKQWRRWGSPWGSPFQHCTCEEKSGGHDDEPQRVLIPGPYDQIHSTFWVGFNLSMLSIFLNASSEMSSQNQPRQFWKTSDTGRRWGRPPLVALRWTGRRSGSRRCFTTRTPSSKKKQSHRQLCSTFTILHVGLVQIRFCF